MRILHALPALNRGGTERLVLALASYQQQKGHSVVVVTFNPLNLWPDESAHLHIKTFACTFAIHRLFRSPLHDAQEFAQFLSDWKPDVVHSHSHWTERIVLACLVQPVVLLQHFHLEYQEWRRPRWNLLRNWCGRWQLCLIHRRRHTSFLAVSQATTAYYRKHLPSPLAQRLQCLPNFLCLPVRSTPRSAPLAPMRLLAVGRLVAVKRHDRLLDLAAELMRCGVNFELSITGDGPLRHDLETRIQQGGLSSCVRCCGNQSDILSWYEKADILLHPAESDSFGLVILEAMARGVPPIVEQSSMGPRDFLSPGINGFSCDFTDASAVAKILMKISSSPAFYHQLSSEGIETAKNFSLSCYWRRLAAIYASSGWRSVLCNV